MANTAVVNLTIPEDKYKYLKLVLDNHKDFLHKVKMPELAKDSLIKDTHIIRTILETGEKGASSG
jgi:hypothetical protein